MCYLMKIFISLSNAFPVVKYEDCKYFFSLILVNIFVHLLKINFEYLFRLTVNNNNNL